jgi:hypothetical protein
MHLRPAGLLTICVWALPAGSDAAAPEPKWPPPIRPASSIVFPDDAGAADVRKEYGAKGDGVTDDTEALQKAFNSNNDDHGRLIHLPAGTYLVSRKLVCLRDGKPWYGLQLIGEHRDRTILKLKDKCPGFDNPEKPETFVQFSSKESVWGNMAHWNSCWNLTIDTGSGNPGAIATNYYASNHGSMRDCVIRSGDGAGVCGINMNGPWPGPCLVADSQIVGFDTGIAVGTREYGVTFRNVLLDRQRKVGLWNQSNLVSVHRLRVRDCAGPAIQNLRRDWVPGMLTLIDSDLGGRGQEIPAIEDVQSVVWLRNVKASGYAGVLKGVPSPVVQHASGKPQGLWPPSGVVPNLPSQDPPVIPWDPPELWARGGNADQTQKAIDSGKTTVYIPYGEHTYEKPVVIRGNVRRIIGMKTNLGSGKGLNGGPMWIYESTAAPAVEFCFLTCGTLEHRAPKPLVLRTMRGCAYSGNAKGCGPLFIEDVCAGPWTFTNPIRVWAWQWNPEVDTYQVKAAGGAFWVCGWKTEGNGTQFVLDGSVLELLGGLVYPHNMKDGIPMFTFKDSAAAMLVRTCSYGGPGTPDRAHDVKVVETRGGETRQTPKLDESLFVAGDESLLSRALKPADGAREREGGKGEGGEAAPPKPAAPKPVADAAALAAWDAKLMARLQEELKDGRKTKFQFAMLGQECQLAALDGKGAIRVRSGGSEMDLTWKVLTPEDKKCLVLGLLREDRADDIALAAFYHLAAGDVEKGQAFLARAGPAGEDVKAAFK